MYSFNIVKAKYSRQKRNTLGIILFVALFLFIITLATIIDNSKIGTIIIVLHVIIISLVNYKILEKTYPVGTIEFDEDKITIY
jgi:formate hydrogenlyase subunit 4